MQILPFVTSLLVVTTLNFNTLNDWPIKAEKVN